MSSAASSAATCSSPTRPRRRSTSCCRCSARSSPTAAACSRTRQSWLASTRFPPSSAAATPPPSSPTATASASTAAPARSRGARDESGAAGEVERAASLLRPPLAARSSAVGEDAHDASFAGQHLTCLNVPSAAEAVAAVSEIRRSAHEGAALVYRARLGVTEPPRAAVVLQELVDADCAGVLFTRNPLDAADELVVEAAWGLGEAVVAGLVTPDRFRLRRDGSVLEWLP